MVYNELLKREIPENWEVTSVSSVLKNHGFNVKINTKDYLEAGKIPIIDQSTHFIAGYTNNIQSKISILKEPAIVFGDHTRILKLINFDFARGADGTQILFSNNSRMPQFLFYYTLNKIDLSNYGYARHFKFLKEANIVLPDNSVAKNFNRRIETFYDKILNNIIQNKEIATLRDWLLPMLMNGQIKVED
ncbi:hypothetical protein [Chryseobacterium sp. P1-3]|uniref:hypothetical protein n=1 Tax=Chryseobacterium sp. (strain P1-3) TaxID=1517683 RepID=UPI000AB732F0|nr:hypothetical protein [Chryseobacterium sp. P1-3]